MKRYLIFFLTVISLLITGCPVYAESSVITVSPSVVDLDLAKDQPQITLTYTNNTDQEVTLSFHAQDIDYLQRGYTLQFINGNPPKGKSSVSNWITFDKTELALLPHDKGSISISIVPNELLPGTNYASIQASVEGETVNGKVTVNQILSTLLFVRTNTGKEVEKADLSQVQLVQTEWQYPNEMIYQFANKGTVDLVPYGTLRVMDPFGRVVQKVVLNQNSLRTMPESQRDYQELLSSPHTFLIPGKYTATVSLQYGKRPEALVASYAFYSFGSLNPYVTLLGISIVLGCILIVIKRKGRVIVRLIKRK